VWRIEHRPRHTHRRPLHRPRTLPALAGVGVGVRCRIPTPDTDTSRFRHQAPTLRGASTLRLMPTAVIVDAVRTPIGKRNGALSAVHAVDRASEPLRAPVERNDLDPALIEDVVMGCTMTVGEQAMNIARNAVLAAGFPDTVPGTTVDRQCGSAQQAVHFAAQA